MRYSADRLAVCQRHAPSVASATLALLLALELARAGAVLLEGRSTGPAVAQTIAPARAAVPRVDIGRIVNAHLFGISVGASADEPDHAPPAGAGLTMVGTIAEKDPEKGVAIIGSGGEFHVYSVGQPIGDATLRRVYADHVILERDGSAESLMLPHAEPGQFLRDRPAHEHTATTASNTSKSIPAATAIIETIADSDSETDPTGKWLGIRVVAGRDPAAFNQSGLKGGDVILAINGNKLEDSENSQNQFRQLATGATVTVLRWGKTQDVTLNLAP